MITNIKYIVIKKICILYIHSYSNGNLNSSTASIQIVIQKKITIPGPEEDHY